MRREARKCKSLLERARKMNITEDITAYKERYRRKRNDYVAAIKIAKRTSWRNFVTEEGNKDPWGLIHKISTEKLRKVIQLGSLMLPNGSITGSWQESAMALCKKFSPQDEKSEESEAHKAIRLQNRRYSNQNMETELTMHEIDEARRSAPAGSNKENLEV